MAIHKYIIESAEKHPQRVAIDEGNGVTCSYAELVASMNTLAQGLQMSEVGVGDRVGVFLQNGISACKAIAGTLRADAAYVALSTDAPPARLAFIVEDAHLFAIVTEKEKLDLLRGIVQATEADLCELLIVLDATGDEAARIGQTMPELEQFFRKIIGLADLPATPEGPREIRTVGEDLAYVMFTSGTTGRPKGVMVSHGNVDNFITWAVGYFGFTPQDRLSNHSAISFDLSVFDIFCAFKAGATVCPVIAPGDRMFPAKFIERQKITVWFSVPSVLGFIIKARELTPGRFNGVLRAAAFCGEALNSEYAAKWLETHPDIPIYNLYGPTEATVACSYFNVGRDQPFDREASIPIGRPCDNMQLLILDESGQRIEKPGEIGHLYLVGSQLAYGYWRRPDLTSEVFVPNPFKSDLGTKMYNSGDLAYLNDAGMVCYAGRADTQIKYQGYRIELGEIERVVCRADPVNEAVAVFIQDPNNPKIVVVVTCHSDAGEDEDSVVEKIYQQCERYLPSYSIPHRVVITQQLTKNVNGKLDRKLVLNRLLEGAYD